MNETNIQSTKLQQLHSPLAHSPLEQYQRLVNSKEIAFDAAQQQAVALLQQLYMKLLSTEKFPSSSGSNSNTKRNINSKNKSKLATAKGIYLWGKVGRGKTFLMDLFVNSLSSSFDTNIAKRQHFHHFMQDVHTGLNELKGKQDPLKRIAQAFAKQHKVLCFDEFFVSDIGDAMLLGNLLQYLFELNVVVICTSNCVPQELYKNGLQRDRFLPAIAAIEQHTDILHLSGLQDHRHRTLTYVQNYFLLPKLELLKLELPDAELLQFELHQNLLARFGLSKVGLSQVELGQPKNKVIKILGRDINYLAKSNETDVREGESQKEPAICFEFNELCQGARSHLDYVEIAKQFKTILLFNVPPMSGQSYERIKARGTEDNGTDNKRAGYGSSGQNKLHNVSASITGEREVVLAPMDDAVRRFIALVDECYDAKLNLVITAYVPQEQLYNSGTLMFEFERTKSRLVEMASLEYLSSNFS